MAQDVHSSTGTGVFNYWESLYSVAGDVYIHATSVFNYWQSLHSMAVGVLSIIAGLLTCFSSLGHVIFQLCIGKPHIYILKFFNFLPLIQFLLGAILIVIGIAFSLLNTLPILAGWRWWKQINSIDYRYAFIKVGRTLCPVIFPGLFTKHKMRTQAQDNTL